MKRCLQSKITQKVKVSCLVFPQAQGGEIGVEACSPLDIDHSVGPVESMRGGRFEALIRFEKFLQGGLDRYDTGRNDTDDPATSGLSPWIHFGHISSFEIVLAVLDKANWDMIVPARYDSPLVSAVRKCQFRMSLGYQDLLFRVLSLLH